MRATDIQTAQFNTSFTVLYQGEKLGVVRLQAPGEHNVKNALASVACGMEMGMEFKTIKRGLERFEGVYRRFQKKYSNGVMLIDDYAHHPTEVQATLQAAHRGWPDRRVIAVFQPHLYSRTQNLYKEFGLSFFDAEVLVVTDVYPSREKPIKGISGALIASTAKQYGHKNVHYVCDKKTVADKLKNLVQAGDIVITMGAGDIYLMGEEFTEWLELSKPFE